MTAERKKRSGKHIYFKIRSVLGVSRVNVCHSEPQSRLFEKKKIIKQDFKKFFLTGYSDCTGWHQ